MEVPASHEKMANCERQFYDTIERFLHKTKWKKYFILVLQHIQRSGIDIIHGKTERNTSQLKEVRVRG